MGQISLKGMEFYAYHGCHEEEEKTGNRFVVDLEFDAITQKAETTDDISKTIDYQKVYLVIKYEMEIRSKLLEHLSRRIMESLKINFPAMKNIRLNVAKMNPPLGGKVERVQFTLQEKG